MALWCRRLRAGSSLSARMKRPATSQGARKHGVQVSQHARQIVIFPKGKVTIRTGWSACTEDAWWHTSEQGIRSIAADKEGMLARTFSLDAPISSGLSLMPMSTTLLERSLKKVSSAMQLSCRPCY